MKKQILFLTFLVLALTLSISNTYGQLLPDLSTLPTYCPTPTPVEAICGQADELHPVPGTPYDYTIEVQNGGVALINWFVTTEPAFIAGGVLTTDIEDKANSDYVQAAGTAYNDPANTSNTVEITWKSFPISDDVFLVTYVTNEDGCTDNIEVYKIQPVHIFTLDIAAITGAGAENTLKSDCVSPVVGAYWNGTEVEMDYGANYIYFAVNAANFSHSWKPSFELAVTNSTSTVVPEVHWAYPDESWNDVAGTNTPVWHSTVLNTGVYTSTDAVLPETAGATGVGAAGECIIVRLTIDHEKDETLTDIGIDFAVDGIMYDFSTGDYITATLGDVHHDSGVTDVGNCTGIDSFDNDRVQYTLTARPTVNSQTPDATTPLPFETKN